MRDYFLFKFAIASGYRSSRVVGHSLIGFWFETDHVIFLRLFIYIWLQLSPISPLCINKTGINITVLSGLSMVEAEWSEPGGR